MVCGVSLVRLVCDGRRKVFQNLKKQHSRKSRCLSVRLRKLWTGRHAWSRPNYYAWYPCIFFILQIFVFRKENMIFEMKNIHACILLSILCNTTISYQKHFRTFIFCFTHYPFREISTFSKFLKWII